MSKQVTINDTLEIVPSGYTGSSNMTTSSSYPISNGYDGVNSSDYARFTLSTSTSGHIYYTFDTSAIPTNATINSVECSVRARVSNTQRVTNTSAQLYSGTTAKGSSSSFASTSSTHTFDLTTGTWTRSELNNLRLYIGGTGSSSTSSKYIYFYGADISITYSLDTIAYEVTLTSNVSGITVEPTSQDVITGNTWEGKINVNDITGYVVTDNNVDVTSQLVRTHVTTGATQTFVPASYDTSGSISGSYYQHAIGNGSDTTETSSGNNYASGGSSSTAHIDYSFNITDIPSNATITAVSCSVKGKAESSTVDNSHFSRVGLYVGDTEISETEHFSSTSDSVITVTATTIPSLSDLSNLILRHSIGYYGGNVVGATLSITYTVPISGDEYYYKYTLSNVSADHTIVFSLPATETKSFYLKINNGWKNVAKSDIKIKVNNTWKTPSKIYVKINNNWKEIE